MNKLEVGMYVRTKTFTTGKIGKLLKIGNICITDNGAIDINQIIKSSHNIIDLIEVGDYVNGERVWKIYEVNDYYEYSSSYRFYEKTIETENDEYECIPDSYLYKNKDIKSILTKEQFESMEYKVGDSNE